LVGITRFGVQLVSERSSLSILCCFGLDSARFEYSAYFKGQMMSNCFNSKGRAF